ncbi:uncharacterized protein LOC114410369 [Glycine soja]|uniref:Uncharacterized protein n=1 Tax=Glycine soja TaxID=3848 RepID=A0A445L4Y4_GLYSO|nr:uncharacterized protein LOC114410369 [Glycine soja]RZC18161.1 hypothetical protein D0Y65_010695 [Glycine soja]
MLDPRTHHLTNSFELYDATRHKPHTWDVTNSGLWPSKPALEEAEVDDSGICSPPMRTTSPPRRKNNHRSLSPTSRTQAIVRGQRELMEMVKNMPESNYELSLKDLVEHHMVVDATRHEKNAVEERNLSSVYNKREKNGGSRKVDNNNNNKNMAQVKRNGNIDRGGFYLKMGLPFPFGSKDKKKKIKKKNESLGNSSSSRVTPKPSDGSAKGGVVDKEWWKKSPLACKESDSGESSINSDSGKSSGSSSSNSSSSRSNSRRENSGRRCWPFIRRPKNRTQKSKISF